MCLFRAPSDFIAISLHIKYGLEVSSCSCGFIARDNGNKVLLNLRETMQLHVANMLKCISDWRNQLFVIGVFIYGFGVSLYKNILVRY